MKKKYIIKYCGKKLDEIEARYPKEAIEKIRNKINFEAIETSQSNEKENKEVKR